MKHLSVPDPTAPGSESRGITGGFIDWGGPAAGRARWTPHLLALDPVRLARSVLAGLPLGVAVALLLLAAQVGASASEAPEPNRPNAESEGAMSSRPHAAALAPSGPVAPPEAAESVGRSVALMSPLAGPFPLAKSGAKEARKQLVIRILIGVGLFLAVGTAFALARQLWRYVASGRLRRDRDLWRAHRASMSEDERIASALQDFYLYLLFLPTLHLIPQLLHEESRAVFACVPAGWGGLLWAFGQRMRSRIGVLAGQALVVAGALLALAWGFGGTAGWTRVAGGLGEALVWAAALVLPIHFSAGWRLVEDEGERRRKRRRLTRAYYGLLLPAAVSLRLLVASGGPWWIPMALVAIGFAYCLFGYFRAIRVRYRELNSATARRWDAAQRAKRQGERSAAAPAREVDPEVQRGS